MEKSKIIGAIADVLIFGLNFFPKYGATASASLGIGKTLFCMFKDFDKSNNIKSHLEQMKVPEDLNDQDIRIIQKIVHEIISDANTKWIQIIAKADGVNELNSEIYEKACQQRSFNTNPENATETSLKCYISDITDFLCTKEVLSLFANATDISISVMNELKKQVNNFTEEMRKNNYEIRNIQIQIDQLKVQLLEWIEENFAKYIEDKERNPQTEDYLFMNIAWLHKILSCSTYDFQDMFDQKFLENQYLCNQLWWQLINCITSTNDQFFRENYPTLKKDDIEIARTIIMKLTDLPNNQCGITEFFKYLNDSFMISEIDKVDCTNWIIAFKKTIGSDAKYRNLREYFIIESYFIQHHTNYYIMSYINKIVLPSIFNGQTMLALNDLYTPTDFDIINNPDSKNGINSVLEYLKRFCFHSFRKKVKQDRELFQGNKVMTIYGNQCAGKTTLIAKLLHDSVLEANATERFYLLDFSNLYLTAQDLSIPSICTYLNCNAQDLSGSVLILDGYEEIGRNDEHASNTLIRFLRSLYDNGNNCRVIVTVRSSSNINLGDFNQIQVELKSFSLKRALDWYQKYLGYDYITDKAEIDKQVNNISARLHILYNERLMNEQQGRSNKGSCKSFFEMLFLPHFFSTCIIKGIDFEQVDGLGSLYMQAFIKRTAFDLHGRIEVDEDYYRYI